MKRRPLILNSRSQLRWSTLSLDMLLSRGPLGALRSRRPFQLSSPRLRLMDMLVDLPDMLLVDLPSLLRPSGSDQPLSGASPQSPISKHQRTTKSSKLRFRRTHRQGQPPEAVAAVARGRAEANPSTVSATHNQVARTGARRSSTGIHPGGHVPDLRPNACRLPPTIQAASEAGVGCLLDRPHRRDLSADRCGEAVWRVLAQR